jgi:hypothetical protein
MAAKTRETVGWLIDNAAASSPAVQMPWRENSRSNVIMDTFMNRRMLL